MLRALPLLALATTLMTVAAPAPAQDAFDNPACAALSKAVIPPGDEPDAATRTRLSACDSENLYYADGARPDYKEARLCAFIERGKGNEVMFGGSAVLMMVYANGYGVKRNVELAKKFACEVQGAPAELDGRLEHLDAMAQQASPPPLDLCDDITSGYMMGFCADRGAQVAKVDRDQRVAALSKGWSDADRGAFARLRAAADSYFDAVVDGEVDMSGTARGALAVGAREELESKLAESLQAFEQGKLPQGSAQELAAADTSLNASYAKAMKAAKPIEGESFSSLGTVAPDGIRAAERAWIKYRDAWVIFGAHKYPAVPADAWRTWFTRERDEALKGLAGEGE